jgi:hypothetical protein
LEILDLVARTLGLQREQLRVSDTESIPSDAGSISNVAESIRSDEDYDAGSILNDADSIPSDAGSISNDADSIPSDEVYIPGDKNSSIRDKLCEMFVKLNEFLFCVKVLRLIASNGAVPEGTSFMPLDLSMPDVEEASRSDTERLFRIVEGYKAKSVPQGAVEKLAELAVDKLSATTSYPRHLRSIEYDDVQLAGFLGRGSAGSVFECRFHGQMAAAKITYHLAEVEAKLQTR